MKRQNLKSWMLLLLAALLTPVQVAAETFEVDGIYYSTLTESTVEVVAPTNDTKYSGDVTIPISVNYEGDSYLVVGIGDQAFQGAQSLTSVQLPCFEEFGFIGDYAFNDCSLTSFTIPVSIGEIGQSAFLYCDKMKDLYVCATDFKDFTIGSNAFNGINTSSNVCTLHVPTGTTALYQDHTQFSRFKVIEEFTPPIPYDLLVAGTCVTSENMEDILGDGAASYSPADNILTLKKNIDFDNTMIPVIYYFGTETFTLRVANDVVLNATQSPVINSYGTDIAITGSAQLTMNSANNIAAIIKKGSLTIDQTKIVFSGYGGIQGDNNLIIRASSIQGEVTGSDPAFSWWKTVTLIGCHIEEPAGGKYDESTQKLVDAEGNSSKTVSIQLGSAVEKYALNVAGVEVTSENMTDILGDGSACYNPGVKRLTIKGDITAPAGKAAVFNTGIEDLTIQVEKDAVFSSSGSPTIYSTTSMTTLTGKALLTLKAPDSMPISVLGDMQITNLQVAFEDCKFGISGLGSLYVERASIVGSVTDGTPICNWAGVTTDAISFIEPEEGKYDISLKQIVDKDGNPSKTVKFLGVKNPDLSFSKTLCRAKPGTTFIPPMLKAPMGDITYSSSNPAVAVVGSCGQVTIVGEGVAVITATYQETGAYNAATAQYCIVSQESEAFFHDVNGDGKVTITDAVSVVDAILNGASE